MSSCSNCAYLRYEGNDRHICSHKQAQQVLLDQGVASFIRSQYVAKCPFASIVASPRLTGIEDIDELKRIVLAKKVLKDQPVNQGSLF